MSAILLRLNHWWNARESTAVEQRLTRELVEAREQVAALKESNSALESRQYIMELERIEFLAVQARNLQRVKGETKFWGGQVVKADLPGESAT